MSYYAAISFKMLKHGEIYPFFQAFKKKVSHSISEIAEYEFSYMPSVRYEHLYADAPPAAKTRADEAWAKGVFTMRFFYLAEHELLGVFGVPTVVQDIFDKTIYFQNSCDQDYDFDEWAAVPVFAQIAEKWRTATDEAVKAKYIAERDGECDEGCADLDYYRRTFAYDEIWALCEGYMWHDEQAVHLSLFGYYDFEPIGKFVKMCGEKWQDWLRQPVKDGDSA
jgi:hypothetical protein